MSIRMNRKEKMRPSVLPQPACIYGYSKYPERLRVSFSDGKTKVYDEANMQPRPVFFSNAENKRMNNTPGRYQLKRGWCT